MTKRIITRTTQRRKQTLEVMTADETTAAIAAAVPAAPTATSLGTLFGTHGQYLSDSRYWGQCFKTDSSGTLETYFMNAPLVVGGAAAPAADTTNRYWNRYETGVVLNDVAGLQQLNADQFHWGQGPRLMMLIRTASAAESGIATQRIWAALTDANLSGVSTSNVIKYVGFRYDTGAGDTNWMICSGDGAAASAISTGVPVVADTEYFFDLNLENTASLAWTINGTSGTKATNLPTGVLTAKGKWLVTITSLAAATQWRFRFHHAMLRRR